MMIEQRCSATPRFYMSWRIEILEKDIANLLLKSQPDELKEILDNYLQSANFAQCF